MKNNLDIIAHVYNGIKHDNSVPNGKITEAKLSDEVKTNIEQRIDEVEEVTATALCDLDSRVTTNTTNVATKGDKILISNETATSKEIEPNKFYKWGTVSALTITLKTPTDNTIVNEYMFEFVSGSTATSLTLPAAVEGIDTTAIEANKIYHVSIVDNVGVIYGVDNA